MKFFCSALLTFITLFSYAQAGCNCQSGHAVAGPHVGAATGPLMMARPMMVRPVVASASADVVVLPGTVGQTYSRVSHPIPENEHPRTAMLAVRDKRAVRYLTVQRMGGFRMQNGIWLFETTLPLYPGQDNIVRVEARRERADVQPYEVKFVRLIPGRIVYLDF